MQRRVSVVAATLVCVSTLAGCGGASGGPTIATATAMRTLKAAGFHRLALLRDDEFAGEPVIDSIVQRRTPRTRSALLPSVELTNWGSNGKSTKVWRPGPHGALYVRAMYRSETAGGHVIVPPDFHFSLKKAFSARICNVVLWSYNAQSDPRLTARLHRAVHLLRLTCG